MNKREKGWTRNERSMKKPPNLDEKPNGDEEIQMWMKQKKKMKKEEED
jgi:hypothetical protein